MALNTRSEAAIAYFIVQYLAFPKLGECFGCAVFRDAFSHGPAFESSSIDMVSFFGIGSPYPNFSGGSVHR